MALHHAATRSPSAGAPTEVLADRALMGRALAYLFGSGVALALLAVLLPESVAVDDMRILAPVTAGVAVAALAVLAVLVMGSEVLRLWTFQCVLACGTALITAAIHFSGEISTVYVMFYVWVTLYAFYFFSRLQAALQLGFLGLAYSAVVFTDQVDVALAKWLIPIATLVVAGALIATLKDRVRRLIARLSDAVRTDVLTGLTNRRGLEELLELELERGARTRRPACLILGDLDEFKGVNDRFGHQGGDRALRLVAEVLSRTSRRIDAVARVGGDEFVVVMPDSDEHEGYVMAERMRQEVRESLRGEAGGVTISFGVAGFPHHGTDADTLTRAADQALYSAKQIGRDRCVIHDVELSVVEGEDAPEESGLGTVIGLAEVLDRREASDGDHSRTVAHYAEQIARELGLPSRAAGRVGIGARLHDVGKIAVSQSVLRKRGPLNHDEWDEVRKHPELGARILETVEADDIRSWVLAHHERPDGKGYPHGLTEAAIPVEARIIAVAEAYAAMTSDTDYRRAMSSQEARRELVRGAGRQFDRDVLDALFRVLDREREHPGVLSSSSSA